MGTTPTKQDQSLKTDFKHIILYTLDRISCSASVNGKFKEEIDTNVIDRVKGYLSTCDPIQDIDEEGNNPLHLIAKYGLYELFVIIKKHPSFDKLKKMTNKRNETALDLVKLGYNDVYMILNTNNYIDNISILMSRRYFDKSFPILEKEMEDTGCLSNYSRKEMYLLKANQYIEQLSSDLFIETQAKELLKPQLMFKSFFTSLKKEERVTDEDRQEETDEEKLQKIIHDIKLDYNTKIEHLQTVIIPKIESMNSEEIRQWIILLKDTIDQSLNMINKSIGQLK